MQGKIMHSFQNLNAQLCG